MASIDFALVAFDVEDDARAVELLGGRIGRRRVAVLELVVGDGEEGAAERVGVGDGGRVRVDRGFAGGLRLVRVRGPSCADAVCASS